MEAGSLDKQNLFMMLTQVRPPPILDPGHRCHRVYILNLPCFFVSIRLLFKQEQGAGQNQVHYSYPSFQGAKTTSKWILTQAHTMAGLSTGRRFRYSPKGQISSVVNKSGNNLTHLNFRMQLG